MNTRSLTPAEHAIIETYDCPSAFLLCRNVLTAVARYCPVRFPCKPDEPTGRGWEVADLLLDVDNDRLVARVLTYRKRVSYFNTSFYTSDFLEKHHPATNQGPDENKEEWIIREEVMPFSRFLTRRLGVNDPKLLQWIADLGKSITAGADHMKQDYYIEWRRGRKITSAYEAAIGGNSCMCGAYAPFTTFYANNPDHVQLAILRSKKDDRAWGRALVFHDKKVYHRSRIYAENRLMGLLLAALVSDEMEQEQGLREDEIFLTGLEIGNKDSMPYMDTLLFSRSFSDDSIVLSCNANRVQDECGDYYEGDVNGGPWYEGGLVEPEHGYCECGRELHTDDECYYDEQSDEHMCESCYDNVCAEREREREEEFDNAVAQLKLELDAEYDEAYDELMEEFEDKLQDIKDEFDDTGEDYRLAVEEWEDEKHEATDELRDEYDRKMADGTRDLEYEIMDRC